MMIKAHACVGALAALMSLGAISAAAAADLPSFSGAPLVPTPSYSVDYVAKSDVWTGFYAGAHLGGVTTNDFSETNSAWAGGIQAGYTHQMGAFVLGAEIEAGLTDSLYYELAPGAGLTQDWSVAAKGRAGVALDHTLIYGTAGLKVAELSPAGTVTSPAETHAGATFGAGVEQSLGNGLSLRAEYEQTKFFDVASSIGGVGRNDDLTSHALKVGVNYRF